MLFKCDSKVVELDTNIPALNIYSHNGSVYIEPFKDWEDDLYSEEVFQELYSLQSAVNELLAIMVSQNLETRKERKKPHATRSE